MTLLVSPYGVKIAVKKVCACIGAAVSVTSSHLSTRYGVRITRSKGLVKQKTL